MSIICITIWLDLTGLLADAEVSLVFSFAVPFLHQVHDVFQLLILGNLLGQLLGGVGVPLFHGVRHLLHSRAHIRLVVRNALTTGSQKPQAQGQHPEPNCQFTHMPAHEVLLLGCPGEALSTSVYHIQRFDGSKRNLYRQIRAAPAPRFVFARSKSPTYAWEDFSHVRRLAVLMNG